MTAQIDFVPFANDPSGVYVYPIATYQASGATQYGVSAGTADPLIANNAWRQGTVMAAALAQAISSALGGANVLDSGGAGSVTTLQGQITAMVSALAAAATPPGARIGYVGSSAPAGWVLASGRTIGNASSGATERANADTVNLYAVLWPNTLYTVSGDRGASAAADFAAGKTLTLPDYQGRTGVGRDNMSGTAAGRMTSANGLDGTVLGNAGGVQVVALTVAQLASHGHGVLDPQHSHAQGGVEVNIGGTIVALDNGGGSQNTQPAATGISIQNSGSGAAHNNTQPSIIENIIIKL